MVKAMILYLLFIVMLPAEALFFRLKLAPGRDWQPNVRWSNSNAVRCRTSNSLHCQQQPSFDPFEDDPRLKALLSAELQAVQSLSVGAMKEELATSGSPVKGVLEKSNLEKLVARRRVLVRMREAQERVSNLKIREQRADMIEDEMRAIQASNMAELSMIRELQSLQFKIDMDGDLIQQLAVARLGLHRQRRASASASAKPSRPQAATREGDKVENDITDTAASEVDAEVDSLVGELKGIYQRFRTNMDDIDVNVDVLGLLSNATGLQIDPAATSTAAAAAAATSDFVGKLGLTKAEQRAREMISENSLEGGTRQSEVEWDLSMVQGDLKGLVGRESFARASPEVAFDTVTQVGC